MLSLLFIFAEWHALAKLRLHTETTLSWLEQSTTELGQALRRFATYTCMFFSTRELPKEQAAAGRRRSKKTAAEVTTVAAAVPEISGTSVGDEAWEDEEQGTPVNPSPSRRRGRGAPGRGSDRGNRVRARGAGRGRGLGRGSTSISATEPTTGSGAAPPPVTPKQKLFNLLTYKLHSLGDYVRAIRWFGTTDSYSTQPVRPCHPLTLLPSSRNNRESLSTVV